MNLDYQYVVDRDGRLQDVNPQQEKPMPTGKSTLKSRSVWLGMLTVAAGVVGYLVGDEVIVEYPQVVSILVAVQGGLAIVLRFLTTEPIK